MGFFYRNDVAGPGVAKNGPKKKPFFRFWEIFANKFWTFFKINLIYFLFCIPIVTFGPATAAMTALMRNIYLERPQFIFHDFFEQFKKNDEIEKLAEDAKIDFEKTSISCTIRIAADQDGYFRINQISR